MENLYTKAELKENLKKQIGESDNKAIHALMTIYSMQNESEKNAGHTIAANGCGFSGVDSEFMSSLAEQYNKNNYLSPNQLKWVKKLCQNMQVSC